MSVTFADTHNIVAYLNKSDASEGFNQVIDFLNASYIKYALTINLHIYVSCIKQFWNTVIIKQTNDVTRLQALVDIKKVVIKEATIKDALRLDDAKGVDCLPNEEIFSKLARMGRKFNFSKYIFESLVRNVDSSSKFYMYPRFIQLIIQNQLGVDTDVSRDDVQNQSIPSPTPPPQQSQDLLLTSQEALDACAALTRRVKHLEYDKVAQALEITKLKRRVKKLERGNKVKVLKLRRSQKGRMIDALDSDLGVALMDDKKDEKKSEIRRMKRKLKRLSMQEDKPEVQEVVDVVTTSKLITEVVTAASESVTATNTIIAAAEPQVLAATITTAPVRVAAACTRRRKGVVIRDPEKESTTIIHAETKSKDKGNEIMVEEPKPMKKKQKVKMDEEYARKLHEELNKDIDWDVAIDHVKQKAKEDLFVKRYQVMKKRPQTGSQAQRNMVMYLKNVAGFRLDYFKGMSYDNIRLIFEAKFNSNITFLLKLKEQLEEEDNRAIQSIYKTPA
nr:hypothetical protein [Tanacetum cinerariifolium]